MFGWVIGFFLFFLIKKKKKLQFISNATHTKCNKYSQVLRNCLGFNYNFFYWRIYVFIFSPLRLVRTTTQIKGGCTDVRTLWSLKCVTRLILFALIRTSNEACWKSVAAVATLSLMTHLEAGRSFKFSPSPNDNVSKSVMMFPWVKLWQGMIAAKLTFFQGGQWAGKDLRISFVLHGQGLTMWLTGSQPAWLLSLDTGQIWLD